MMAGGRRYPCVTDADMLANNVVMYGASWQDYATAVLELGLVKPRQLAMMLERQRGRQHRRNNRAIARRAIRRSLIYASDD